MTWFFNDISGELASESGVAAIPYSWGLGGWHTLNIPATSTAEQATADAAKEYPNSPPATGGTAKGLQQAPAGATAAATGVNFSSVQNALTAFYDKVTDGKMWRSLGWLLLGIALMIVGIALWIGPSAMRRSPLGIASRALG